MRKHALQARRRRLFKVTTTDSHHSYPVAPNTLNRQFWEASLNEKWVTDVTYTQTKEGWLYLTIAWCSQPTHFIIRNVTLHPILRSKSLPLSCIIPLLQPPGIFFNRKGYFDRYLESSVEGLPGSIAQAIRGGGADGYVLFLAEETSARRNGRLDVEGGDVDTGVGCQHRHCPGITWLTSHLKGAV